MTWNNVPCHHIIIFPFSPSPNCGITYYRFVMTCCDKFTCREKHLICFYNFDFVDKNVLIPFKCDVHICVITMMYMFVNCIYMRYIKHASIKD